jgi:TetR/AcrR family transcriptional regulator, transcriptional repressor for nem operon
MAPRRTDRGDTAELILDVAQRLVQTRGFNAFSYADIAAELGVTKASLHYHFPAKDQLGERLVTRYSQAFLQALEKLERVGAGAPTRLRGYARLYDKVLRDDRMCLCGMLAADQATLPSPMRARLKEFFDANETWLAAVLERGRAEGELHFAGAAVEEARMLVGALQGAMLVARSYREPARFRAAAARLLAGLSARGRSAPAARRGARPQHKS